MSVIVTGASGFLGRALVEVLAARTAEPILAVSRSAIVPPCGVEAIQVADYGEAPSGEILIHLAETRDIAAVERDGEQGLNGAAMRLRRLLQKRYRRVIYVSSATLYGDRIARPRRTDEPVEAESAYARMKLAGEAAAVETGGAAVRLANVYGPGMSPHSVVADILAQIPGAGDLVVRSLRPVRDFLWLADAATGLAAICLSSMRGVLNLGTGIGTSVGQLAQLALEIAGESHRKVVATAEMARPSTLWLDIDATVQASGWRPAVDLRSGLTRLLREDDA